MTTTECARISAEFLTEEMKRVVNDHWFAQVYLCEFGEPAGALFPRELLEAALYKLRGGGAGLRRWGRARWKEFGRWLRHFQDASAFVVLNPVLDAQPRLSPSGA